MATNTRETSRHSSVTMGNTRLMLAMSFLPQNCEISTAEPLASPNVAAVKSDVTALACETPANAISPTFPAACAIPGTPNPSMEEIRLTIMSSRYTTSRETSPWNALGRAMAKMVLKKFRSVSRFSRFIAAVSMPSTSCLCFLPVLYGNAWRIASGNCPLFPRICGKLHASFYVSGV